ncbi:flagellar biosynthesis protein FlhF [Paracoccus rhizosphaerae]|uniref:DUF2497 domain-containing protein n=1 Tax=Paracoccus rhizosphaerae TaxID=1133347 RepID=A0ABV6CNE5_9RHOB|nr:hypothetical protein [Paracoccus rhizosphaerae]
MSRPRRKPPLDDAMRPVPESSRAAPEVARINATLQDIRRLIDDTPATVVEEDVETFLSRRFGSGPLPLSDLRDEHVTFEVLPPISPIVPYRSPAPRGASPHAEPASVPAPEMARLTLGSVIGGWWQWILWKLQAPRIPTSAELAAAAARAARVDTQIAVPAEPVLPAAPRVEPETPAPATPRACPEEAATRSVQRMLDEGTLRDRLNEMIREELQGEMGARFSSNIRAVIRREVATAVDDRL